MANVDPQTEERTEARRKARERLAELDAEWTPERWQQAREEIDRRIAEAA